MGITESEMETLIVEAFGSLPLPEWWQAFAGESLAVWLLLERDELYPARLHAASLLREMLEELTQAECQIHVFTKRPTRRQADASLQRVHRRW